MLEFLAHPRWRIHTTTYVEGARLVRAWLAARPGGEPAGSRFAQLLDAPSTPARLAHATVTDRRVSDTLRDDQGGRAERSREPGDAAPTSPRV